MNYQRVRNTLVFTLLLNLCVSFIKGIVGTLVGSVSMVADAVHSLFDSVSNIVGLISIHVAGAPPDARHQYGHGKFETIGTLAVGVLLIITAVIVAHEGLGRFTSGTTPEITPLAVGVMVATIGVNIVVSLYERHVGREEESSFLLADSQHTASDIFVSLSVLVGFVFISMGYPVADAVIALGIAVLIGKMGVEILYHSSEVLADASAEVDYALIDRVVSMTEGVRGYHDFRCRGKPGEIFCDLHVVVDPDITVREGHFIGDRVSERLEAEVPGVVDVVVHIEPFYGGNGASGAETGGMKGAGNDTDKDTITSK